MPEDLPTPEKSIQELQRDEQKRLDSAQGQRVTDFQWGSGQKGQSRVRPLHPSGAPSLPLIEATSLKISAKHPEDGLAIAILVEELRGSCQQARPNPASHERWGDKKKMELSGVLWYHLERRGDCPNLHEADHLVLVLGDKETLLFCRREYQFPRPERLQAVEQARIDGGFGHELLIGPLCGLLVDGANSAGIVERTVSDPAGCPWHVNLHRLVIELR
jgi:hypothetical protein